MSPKEPNRRNPCFARCPSSAYNLPSYWKGLHRGCKDEYNVVPLLDGILFKSSNQDRYTNIFEAREKMAGPRREISKKGNDYFPCFALCMLCLASSFSQNFC